MKYEFDLPKSLIANEPVEPRDKSRLFIYSTQTDEVIFDTFNNLSRYLPTNSVIIFNDTKVVPAVLALTKITGGTVNITFLFNEWHREMKIKGLPDKGISIGETLYYNHEKFIHVESQKDSEFTFTILVPLEKFLKVCDDHGHVSLPPYIHSNMPEEYVRLRYQAVFASREASVAAPTASLHFTPKVLQSLYEKGIEKEFVTLHVGRGTFAPVTEENIKTNTLYSEPIFLEKKVSERIISSKRHVIAVGTTAMRLLETAAPSILKGEGFEGETNLFITPPFKFKIVDTFITNFHLPSTSLMMLVEAFLEFKGAKKSVVDLYKIAVKEEFRFYTFGDAMLIL